MQSGSPSLYVCKCAGLQYLSLKHACTDIQTYVFLFGEHEGVVSSSCLGTEERESLFCCFCLFAAVFSSSAGRQGFNWSSSLCQRGTGIQPSPRKSFFLVSFTVVLSLCAVVPAVSLFGPWRMWRSLSFEEKGVSVPLTAKVM